MLMMVHSGGRAVLRRVESKTGICRTFPNHKSFLVAGRRSFRSVEQRSCILIECLSVLASKPIWEFQRGLWALPN